MDEKVYASLARCAYVLHLIAKGDHKALANAAEASAEAVALLNEAGKMPADLADEFGEDD